ARNQARMAHFGIDVRSKPRAKGEPAPPLHFLRNAVTSEPNMKMKQRIILAGGSGFLGGLLARHFSQSDFEVVVLTRSPLPDGAAHRHAVWDGCTLSGWARE